MGIVRVADAVPFATHGSTFSSYVAPSRGARELCAWELSVPAGLVGEPHRPTREEILRVLEGELHLTLDGDQSVLHAGDVALVAANAELRVDGGPDGATVWVTTTPGLEAVLSDGHRITPPWAN